MACRSPAFPADALFLIAGPCVLEDDGLNLGVGEYLARLSERIPGGVIFKASFDKANRSNVAAHRGPGIDEGLQALDRVRAATGLRILTDVHEPAQCAVAAQVVDVLQIPAFLCRQTDLLEAAGATGRPVNIKKGQWMHPEGMRGAVDKVRGAAHGHDRSEVAVTERGTFFGYGDLVVDMRSFPRLREACAAPVVFDATHSVQRLRSGRTRAPAGEREEFIPTLALAAVAAGAQGLVSGNASRPRSRTQRWTQHAPPHRPGSAARPDRRCVGEVPTMRRNGAGRRGSRAAGRDGRVSARATAARRASSAIDPHVARRIRLVGLDVDGVMTDGGIYLGDVAGAALEFKRYDIQDGLGVFLLRQSGLLVAIVTGRVSRSVELRAQELRADDLYQDGQARKLPGLLRILERRGVSLAETAFVGDDYPDLAIMRAVGLPVAVANAVPAIKRVAALRLQRAGGTGAVREFAEVLLRARGQWDDVVEQYA